MVTADMLFTQAKPQTIKGKILQFPVTRILVVALFIAPYLILYNTVIMDLIRRTSDPLQSILRILDRTVSIIIILLIYGLYTRFVERRKAHEISTNKSVQETGAGLLISLLLIGFMVSLMSVLGFYRIEGVDSARVIINGIFIFGIIAFIEEFSFRIILFRLMEELLGSWLALVLVAAVFGLAHLGNPNATALTTAYLILSDVLLAAAFIYTRRLWLVWGIHWGWNFFQDGVFGMPNSGVTQFSSWIRPEITGPTWLTGGNFGIEASTVSVTLNFLAGVIILWLAIRKKQVVSPIWTR